MKKTSKYLSALATSVMASGTLVAAISGAMAAEPGKELQPAPPLKPTKEIIEEVVAARKKFGFRHDQEYVRDLLTRPASFGAVFGSLTGGYYATPEEVKELEIRLQVQDDALRIMRGARADRDFAGLYVDLDGVLHIGFTKSAKEKVQGFQKSARHPQRIRTFKATRSVTELEAQKQRILDVAPKLRIDGIQVSQVAIDIKTNKVRVGVVQLDAAKREAIMSRFGAVDIFEGEIEELDLLRSGTASPMRAGMRITNQSGGSCTSNWKARDRDDGKLVMITAGHCGVDVDGTLGGPGTSVYQGVNSDLTPRKVGISDQTTWTFPTVNFDGSRSGAAPVDAMRAPFLSGISSLPWLYAYDDNNSGVFTNGEEAPVGGAVGAVVVGTSVCSAGQFSPGQTVGGNFKNCGTVSQVNVAQLFSRCNGCVDTFTLQNANVADYIAISGDSGAPIWRIEYDGSTWEAIAVGHHTGGPTGSEKFNDANRVEDALNVDIVHF
ncbi:MAG: S1 family peptidase [Candidatus Thiodiazotropha sp. (ex Dulcina madagascariensis)]|nr:S1 family peptidase [Candidatus Thiodiazotropha sp. (ex Dulcina madagascariensis)]MCU7929053.1 S1 family peptidase [Candidatus Thiodiazotropha sp. (ex Dulcina madagascariensis)]